MGTRNSKQTQLEPVILLIALTALGACTKQTPNTFRLIPAEDKFETGSTAPKVFESFQETTKEVEVEETQPAPIDILWVVDNSSSMEPSQQKLRKGFGEFAKKYMKPEWDIRTAVITTDTYLAHPAFKSYLTKTNAVGVSPQKINPTLGPNYAKLLAGIHDGPIPGLCDPNNYYFYNGLSNCQVRDAKDANRGVENCISPKGNEAAESQCVNTVKNNTVHSNKPILSTKSAKSTDELIRDFVVNASVGAAGEGSERGMGSLIQMLSDNESAPSAFFRKGSFRVIIFLADEDDQTQEIPKKVPAEFGPYTEGGTLVLVDSIKKQIDAFFTKLDGEPKPSYMIASIVATNDKTVTELKAQMEALHKPKNPSAKGAQQIGARYMELGKLVGNGSLELDIGEDDYSGILEKIGLTMVTHSKKLVPTTIKVPVTNPGKPAERVYTLKRAPVSSEQMIVQVVRESGVTQTLSIHQFTINGVTMTLTDENLIQSLKPGDRITVKYQPRTLD
jgi:hypothetical protein